MVLTNYFLKREIHKLNAVASERPHQYRSLNDIKHILLICDSKDWDIIRGCIEKLRVMNKTVHTAIFATSSKDVPTWYSNYLLLRADRDVNLLGFPDKALQKQFYHLPADLLIDFSNAQTSPLYYMCLKHPSTFKAGIKHSDESVYDFSIIPPDENNNLLYLFDQLTGYLKTINSK
jgi:hypothetical protein